MRAWHLAPALVALRTEIDARWPKRNRASDGTIGNVAHQKEASDHNPDQRGTVHAIDVTNDATGGPHGAELVALLLAGAKAGDRRLWYVIWNRRIWSRTYSWLPQPYRGPDPHTSHVHISLMYDRHLETDSSRWLARPPAPAHKPPPLPHHAPTTPVTTEPEEPMIAYRTVADAHAYELAGLHLVYLSAERAAAVRKSGTPVHIVTVHGSDPLWDLPKSGSPAK